MRQCIYGPAVPNRYVFDGVNPNASTFYNVRLSLCCDNTHTVIQSAHIIFARS
jgi:hypothetical protein